MNKNFETPDFSGFGIIANSFTPVPEAFLIKEIAEQNIENYNNKNYFDFNNLFDYDTEEKDYEEGENW